MNCHDRARGLLKEKHKDLQKIRKVFVTRDARHSPRLVRLSSLGRTELETMRKEVDFRLLLREKVKETKSWLPGGEKLNFTVANGWAGELGEPKRRRCFPV